MSQYTAGTVNLTNGQAIIVGVGTSWLSNVSQGNLFTRRGASVPYDVASIPDDTHIVLSAPYQGISENGVSYEITSSFTPTYDIPYMEAQDLDTHVIFKRAMLRIEELFILGGGGGGGGGITALSGDVTASGIGSVLTTISAKAVTLAKMADIGTQSFIGRSTTGSGSPEVLGINTVRGMLSINNVENKSSATIRAELTSANVTDALGFIPAQEGSGGGSLTDTAIYSAMGYRPWSKSGESFDSIIPNNLTQVDGGYFTCAGSSAGSFSGGNDHLIHLGYTSVDYLHQIALSWGSSNSQRMGFRTKYAGTWQPWKEIVHDGNFAAYLALNGGGGGSGSTIDSRLTSAEASGLVAGTGADIQPTLQALLETKGHVGLSPANRPEGGFNQFGSLDLRLGNTLGVPVAGSLMGFNAGINGDVAGAWNNEHKPLVCFLAAGPSLDNAWAAQSASRGRVSGLQINGQRGQKTGHDYIYGFSSRIIRQTDRNGFYGGHSSCIVRDMNVSLCYVGYEILKGQYSFFEGLNGTNCAIGVLLTTSVNGGGNLDLPTMRHFNLWGMGVGVLCVANFSGLPTSEIRINGVWSKAQYHKTCAYAFVHDPTTNLTGDGARWIIDGGSTEYNGTGKFGEDQYSTYILPRYTDPTNNVPVATAFYSINIPWVDVYIQKYGRIRIQQYAFQSDTNKSASDRGDNGTEFPADEGPSGIVALLDGPQAVLELDKADFGLQQVYSVRARHEHAWVEFLGPMMLPGGIYENVRQWPNELVVSWDIPEWPRAQGSLMSGWGKMQMLPAGSMECHLGRRSDTGSVTWTNTEILRPSWVRSGTNNDSVSVTDLGSVADPDPMGSGELCSGFQFSGAASTGVARTRYIRGGDSYDAQYNQWYNRWHATMFEIYNMETYPVRLIIYPDNQFVSHLDTNYGNFPMPSLNPALRTHLVPAAVTIWPQQWMKQCLLWAGASDFRISIMRLDHLTDSPRFVTKHMAYWAPYDRDKNLLGSAVKNGWCITR